MASPSSSWKSQSKHRVAQVLKVLAFKSHADFLLWRSAGRVQATLAWQIVIHSRQVSISMHSQDDPAALITKAGCTGFYDAVSQQAIRMFMVGARSAASLRSKAHVLLQQALPPECHGPQVRVAPPHPAT